MHTRMDALVQTSKLWHHGLSLGRWLREETSPWSSLTREFHSSLWGECGLEGEGLGRGPPARVKGSTPKSEEAPSQENTNVASHPA